jgi:hypothetical protein
MCGVGHTRCGTLARVPSRRLLAVLLVGVAVLGGLAGCRTSPTVAAYVGHAQVTVAQLDDAVATRLADPDIAGYAAKDRTGFTRQVLSLRVGEQVYAAVARRYHVEVTDADVRARLAELIGDSDPDAVYTQVAQQQGADRHDVFENVRQQLIRREVAVAAGKADLSDAALQARYAQSVGQLTQTELGIITVPDQATADAVLAQLTADPAAYPALAAQYAGSNTLPAVQSFTSTDLPGVLADTIAATPAGQGFTQTVEGLSGVVVGVVRSVTVPAFADVRSQLADQAASDADNAGQALVQAASDDLHIDLNPRYGVLDKGKVVAGSDGVVKLLDAAGTTGAGGAAGGAVGD